MMMMMGCQMLSASGATRSSTRGEHASSCTPNRAAQYFCTVLCNHAPVDTLHGVPLALRYCRKVKVEAAEGQLPDFDLGKKVGRKIFLQKDRRAVVLCVVDVWDFDGSLPRLALQ